MLNITIHFFIWLLAMDDTIEIGSARFRRARRADPTAQARANARRNQL